MLTAKRWICLVLVLVCLVGFIPQKASAACVDYPDSFYLTQLVSGTCTLCSAAMMVRACMYINGNANWGQVTETSLRPTAWMNGVGLRWSFTHKVEGASTTVSHATVYGISSSKLKELLDKHPEGIVLYCGKMPHAVYLLGYEGDVFYCADTVNGYSGKPIPLASSWLGTKYYSQASILQNVTAYWYVSSYTDPHGTCNCSTSYAGTYQCTATDTDLMIRSGHGTGYTPVGSIPAGATVTVTKASGEGDGHWAHVEYNGISGYASMGYLKKLADSHNYESTVHEPTCEEKGYTEHVCKTCGTSYQDAYTDPLGHAFGPWTDAESGQIRTCTRCNATETRANENAVMATVTAEDLRIRTGPGTNYDVAGYLQPGDRVEIVEMKTMVNVLWGRTEQGWISMDYVQIELPEGPGRMGTVVDVSYLNVRLNPSTAAGRVMQLKQGTQVEILRVITVEGAQWGQIEDGWVSMKYIQLEPEPEVGQMGTVVGLDLLNIRASASTSAAKVGQLKRGDRVEIFEILTVNGEQWGRIANGYVMMKYIQLEETSTEPEPEPEPEVGQLGTVVNVDLLNIRASASLSAQILGQLKRGDRVEIFETKTVDGALWGRIAQGWISMKYIQMDETTVEPEPEPEPETQLGTVVNVDLLNIRASASTSAAKVGQLKRGQQVEIFEIVTVNGEQWGRIEQGYIMMKYIELEQSEEPAPEPEPEPEQHQFGQVVDTDLLNIRASTSTAATKVGQLKRGAWVEILEIVTVDQVQWGRIEEGWIMLRYIMLEPEVTYPVTMKVTGISILNIRASASTAATKVGQLNLGQSVQILEITVVDGKRWGRIEQGWVLMDYLA